MADQRGPAAGAIPPESAAADPTGEVVDTASPTKAAAPAEAEPAEAEAPVEAASAEEIAFFDAPTEPGEIAPIKAAPAETEAPAGPEGPPPPPRILDIEPVRGPFTGGTAVMVRGEGFAEGCVVLIGGVAAKATLEGGSLRFETPARASSGYVDIRVENPDGQGEARINGFHHDGPPRVDQFEPACALAGMGASISIHGADFAEGCAVRLGGERLPSTRMDEGRIEAAVPPPAGRRDHDIGGQPGRAERRARAPARGGARHHRSRPGERLHGRGGHAHRRRPPLRAGVRRAHRR